MLLRLTLFSAVLVASLMAWLLRPLPADAPPVLRLGSTTSTQDSGLLDHLLSIYEAETGVQVLVMAKGTGAVIRDGRAGQVDALLVHNEREETALVAEGLAVERLPIMSNRFLIVGSTQDRPYTGLRNLLRVMASGRRGLFLSRGDASGTHAAELAMWAAHGYDPDTFGDWYSQTGTGMGQTLISANANRAATLVDSATWARHGDRDQLHIWYNGPNLVNPYGYLALDAARVPGVQTELAQDFGTWLAGPEGQAAIGAYTLDGVQAFQPHRAP